MEVKLIIVGKQRGVYIDGEHILIPDNNAWLGVTATEVSFYNRDCELLKQIPLK